MAAKPERELVVRDFGGWRPDEDPHDLEPGSSTEQVNATSRRPGELRVRGGLKPLKFGE